MPPEASHERKIQELEDRAKRLQDEILDHKRAYERLQAVTTAREQVLAGLIDKLIAELGARPYGD